MFVITLIHDQTPELVSGCLKEEEIEKAIILYFKSQWDLDYFSDRSNLDECEISVMEYTSLNSKVRKFLLSVDGNVNFYNLEDTFTNGRVVFYVQEVTFEVVSL